MTTIDEILGINPTSESGLSAGEMFIENNPHGYISKPNLKPFLLKIRDKNKSDLRMLETAVENIKEGVKIVNLPYKQEQDGQEFTWLKIQLGTTKLPIKICLTERLFEFFKDYQRGIIKPSFTLAELLAEAEM